MCLSSYLEFSGTSGFSACEVLLSLSCPRMLLLFREPLVHVAVGIQSQYYQVERAWACLALAAWPGAAAVVFHHSDTSGLLDIVARHSKPSPGL